ncbi:MAG TPA: hypothetical protein EYP71_02705 [Dehalococcoidia bacterium]|nr:hypothetical protein [Dehalococcoidia bacterium]
MPGFDGTGPMGLGPMTGGGRGFCSPWGIGAALRRYGFSGSTISAIPRWMGYGYPYYGASPFFPGSVPSAPQMSTEQELSFLREQAEAMRRELEAIEARISELTAEER